MPESRERLGVLGGTFDPIHNGHLAIARAARHRHRLGRVLLIPAASPPHKPGDRTPFRHRLAMVELAVRGEEGLEASDIEGRRGGVSYTVETLDELTRAHPGADLYFIIGEDTIAELPSWKEAPRIFDLARVVAVNRPGPRRRFERPLFPTLPASVLDRCEEDRVEMEPVDVSSRELRRAAAAGEPFDHGVPPAVAEYIRRHRIYERQP